MSDIKLHTALTHCYFCGEADCIVMDRRLRLNESPVDNMQGKVISMTPCSKCEELMRKGVILITIDNGKSAPGWNRNTEHAEGWMPNPYRTGGFFVVTDDFMRRLLSSSPELLEHALRHRFMFIEHEAATRIGLWATIPKETASDADMPDMPAESGSDPVRGKVSRP